MRATAVLSAGLAAWLIVSTSVFSGCSRAKYRVAADHDAYHAIAERNCDPRWQAHDVNVRMDPRSRYFDDHDIDCAPMPKDDATSHRYMRQVNGMKGWGHWYDNGVRPELENTSWQEQLPSYVELTEEGAVKLDIDSALMLAYIHSPNHQNQLETLYLSALDVSRERFRLESQYFGGYDLIYDHQGDLVPPAIRFDPISGRYIVNRAVDGIESNRLTVGRPFAGNPAVQLTRRFATAGQLLVGFANSFVFEFNGSDANLSASLLNVSFLQPLLRGGGRDVALEQLTFFERALLANLRSYSQFRQGFYTQVAIGEQGVLGPQRGGRGTAITVFSGQAPFLGGYVGLLRQQQEIRNSTDNLRLQQRTLEQLQAFQKIGLIDPVQVEQFRQNVENEKSSLLQSQNRYARSRDQFKVNTLGLPPNLRLNLDDTLIQQFQLVDNDSTAVRNAVAALQDKVGEIPDEADVQVVLDARVEVFAMVETLREMQQTVENDLEATKRKIPKRQQSMDEEATKKFSSEWERLEFGLADVKKQLVKIEDGISRLRNGMPLDEPEAELELDPDLEIEDPLSETQPEDDNDDEGLVDTIEKIELTPTEAAIRDTVILINRMRRFTSGAILVQARARLEAVSVEEIDLAPEDAFQIALANRLDFMNGRAALVDDWRQIQVTSDALQSVLNVTASADVRTARNNPLSFRAKTANAQLGLQFDAPITRLIERNDYRESLINYQRSRRDFIRSRDQLHLGLRVLLRDIQQLRANLEIQREAVAIAILRVDLTGAALEAPVPPPQPGQRAAGFGPTAAINLLSAQSALRDSQNAFLGVWLDYYAAKMRLARELGLMTLDIDGRWEETAPPSMQLEMVDDIDGEPLPPEVNDWLTMVEQLPEDFTFEAPTTESEIEKTGLVE